MKILSIDTSCDETSVAITEGRRILSNVIFSQINIHQQYGGVYPLLAKREHEAKIDLVIEKSLKNAHLKLKDIDSFAVTFGPGLVVALEVGIRKAKELALKYNKPLIPIDHIEGHIYSCFAQNSNGNPKHDFVFPFLAFIASGGHTEIVLVKDHINYQILGKTLDDASGEAFDKAAKILGMSYPGGPIIEKLAEIGDYIKYSLPVPMLKIKDLNFSYSGLKTAFKYLVDKMDEKEKINNLPHLAASFQYSIIKSIENKLIMALKQYPTKILACGGGVMANKPIRKAIRAICRDMPRHVSTLFPPNINLVGDNAAMVGVAAYFKFQKGIYLKDNFYKLERVGRPDLNMWMRFLK